MWLPTPRLLLILQFGMLLTMNMVSNDVPKHVVFRLWENFRQFDVLKEQVEDHGDHNRHQDILT